MKSKVFLYSLLVNFIFTSAVFAQSSLSCSVDSKGKAVVIDSEKPGKEIAAKKAKSSLAKLKSKLKTQKSAIKSSKRFSKTAKTKKLAAIKVKSDALKEDSAVVKTCKDGSPPPNLNENQVAGTIEIDEQSYFDEKISKTRCMLAIFVRFPDTAGVVYSQVEYLFGGDKVTADISPPYFDSFLSDSSFFGVALRFNAPVGQHQYRIKVSADFPPCEKAKEFFLKSYKSPVLTIKTP